MIVENRTDKNFCCALVATFGNMSLMLFTWCFSSLLAPYPMNSFFVTLFSKLSEVLKDQGTQNITGSKDTVRAAFKVGLIDDGETWMEMIQDRNRTSHTYNESTAKAIATNITSRYFSLLIELRDRIENLSHEYS